MVCPARILSLMLLTLMFVPVPARAADAPAPIERFFQVDDRLFRGAQPDLAGFKYLRDLGVRTIINLREAKDADRLNELDNEAVEAVEAGEEERWLEIFATMLELVRTDGTPVADDVLEESDVILPPPDTTFAEASEQFTGDGLIPD